jgi:hypothetical protein
MDRPHSITKEQKVLAMQVYDTMEQQQSEELTKGVNIFFKLRQKDSCDNVVELI